MRTSLPSSATKKSKKSIENLVNYASGRFSSGRLWAFMGMLMIFSFASLEGWAQSLSASIGQGSNNTATSPHDPIKWVNGNLNPQQAHLVEGYSVPYRATLGNLAPYIGGEISILLFRS